MVRIGITGNIGAGKSTVAKIWQTFGAKHIDADKIGHKVLGEKRVKEKLVKTFGREILNKNGKISRTKLAKVAFRSKKNQRILNTITHSLISQEICRRTKGKGMAVVEASLLFESDLKNKLDYTIWVSAPQRLKIKRAQKKYEDVRKRLFCQMPENKGRKLADFIIENKGSLRELREKCKKLWQVINEKLARGRKSPLR